MLASVFRLFGMEVLQQMKLTLFMPGKKAKTRYTVRRMLSSFRHTEDYDNDLRRCGWTIKNDDIKPSPVAAPTKKICRCCQTATTRQFFARRQWSSDSPTCKTCTGRKAGYDKLRGLLARKVREVSTTIAGDSFVPPLPLLEADSQMASCISSSSSSVRIPKPRPPTMTTIHRWYNWWIKGTTDIKPWWKSTKRRLRALNIIFTALQDQEGGEYICGHPTPITWRKGLLQLRTGGGSRQYRLGKNQIMHSQLIDEGDTDDEDIEHVELEALTLFRVMHSEWGWIKVKILSTPSGLGCGVTFGWLRYVVRDQYNPNFAPFGEGYSNLLNA